MLLLLLLRWAALPTHSIDDVIPNASVGLQEGSLLLLWRGQALPQGGDALAHDGDLLLPRCLLCAQGSHLALEGGNDGQAPAQLLQGAPTNAALCCVARGKAQLLPQLLDLPRQPAHLCCAGSLDGAQAHNLPIIGSNALRRDAVAQAGKAALNASANVSAQLEDLRLAAAQQRRASIPGLLQLGTGGLQGIPEGNQGAARWLRLGQAVGQRRGEGERVRGAGGRVGGGSR
jgi:hypothetical protein